MHGGPEHDAQAAKAEDHAQPAAHGQRFAAGQNHLNQGYIERNHGLRQRGHSAGHGLLRIDQADVAAAEQQ